MRLTSLVIVGLSLTALPDVVSAGDRFNSEVRRVDVIGKIHHQAAQTDSSKGAGPVKRVDVIEKINDQASQVATNKNAGQGPAYPYTKPMNR
jgi:hypothetical protein